MVAVVEYTTFAPRHFIDLFGNANRNAANRARQRLIVRSVDDKVQMIA